MKFFFILLLAVSNHAAEPQLLFEEALFSKNDYGVREGKRTDGVIVIKDGKKIFEKYARGYDANKKHILWSISKTITALLYGVAVKEGKIRLEQSLCEIEKTINPDFCKIKFKDLLSWTTGIDWIEEYENAREAKESTILAMLFGEGRRDMAKFVQNLSLVKDFEPGQVWRYSSGDTILASYYLGKIFLNEPIRAVYQKKLFDPLGITNWVCEEDGAGTCTSAYNFYLTLPDLVKVGELILNGGKYKGREIVPESFIQYMKTMPDAYKTNRRDNKAGFISGSSLWINDVGGTGLPSPWPKLPVDAVAAQGHWGQYLVVVPSQKIVAARVADHRTETFKIKDFTAAISDLTTPSVSEK